MKKLLMNGLNLWQFESLEKEPGVKHFVTDRHSDRMTNDFTLSFSSSPNKEEIRENRRLLAKAMSVQPGQLYFPSQVHKTRIVNVTNGTSLDELMETDALITNKKGLCIAVMSADCVPILLYDRVNKAVAAIHSGWRGTVAHILEKTLREMNHAFGTIGKNLIAGIGPSVSQDSYEVGDEVIQEVQSAFGKESGLMITQENKKARLDLWSANKLQLLNFGVPALQIEISNLCTVKNNSNFFSARRGDSGRFAAGILLT
jgi:YfiH family protein